MADTAELVLAICELIKISEKPVPITLKNHSAELASFIIIAVVEKCSRDGIGLTHVCVDPEWASDLGLANGTKISEHSNAAVKHERGLGRQVRFDRLVI